MASYRKRQRGGGESDVVHLREAVEAPALTTAYAHLVDHYKSSAHPRKDMQVGLFREFKVIDPTLSVRVTDSMVYLQDLSGHEAVFEIQGYLGRVQLPPYGRDFVTDRPQHVRQSIDIVGPGNSAHALNIQAMVALTRFMNAALPRDVDGPEFTPATLHSLPIITLSNMFFTKTCDMGKHERCDPSSTVDPDGDLAEVIARGEYSHTMDNLVEFNCVGVDAEGMQCFEDMNPADMKVGHLVHAQFSLRYVRKHKGWSIAPRLMSVLTLEKRGAYVLAELHANAADHRAARKREPSHDKTPKRRRTDQGVPPPVTSRT